MYSEIETIINDVVDKVRNECSSHDEEIWAKKEAAVLIDEFYVSKLDDAYDKGMKDEQTNNKYCSCEFPIDQMNGTNNCVTCSKTLTKTLFN